MPLSIRPSRRILKLPLAYVSGFWSLIILLALSSGLAYAEWVQIDKIDQEMTTYVDPDTIRRKGDLVKMWHMFDLTTAQTISGQASLSVKSQEQYDCPEELHRYVTHTYFSGHMGSGKVIYSSPDEGKWQPVPPKSIAERLWKYACGNQ